MNHKGKEDFSKKNKFSVIKKLRLKFIITMMLLVTIFLSIIIVYLYASAKSNMKSESIKALQASLNANNASHLPESEIEADELRPEFPNKTEPPERINNLPEMKTPVMTIIVSGDGTVDVIKNNIFFIENTAADSLAEYALSINSDSGILEAYNLRFLKRTTQSDTIIAFADISSEKNLLKSQLINSLWISLSVFIVMLLISLFLSKLIIKPVETAWKTQEQFIADASHELKTPLTVILSNTNMLIKANCIKDEKNLQRLDNINAESERMKGLVESLMALAKSSAKKNNSEYENLDMSFIVNSSLLTWEPTIYDNGKKLEYEIADDLYVYGDADKLRRLTDILIDNAVKYSYPNSTITITLENNKTAAKKSLLLSVSNHGEPLSEEQISNIFKRFYRVDKSRGEIPGFGLGLSIASSIVSEHHAKMWADSDKKDKNTFYVSIPLSEAKAHN